MTAEPLGYDIHLRRGDTPINHVEDNPDYWCFCIGDDPFESPGVIEIPKEIAPTRNIAEEIMIFVAGLMDVAYHSGKDFGRAEAQRHFRLALGVEVPTREEAAYWNNPVPLKKA